MIRYRPPQKKSAPYITPTGYNLLNDELRRLWKKDRPKIVEQVSEAAALGDRSENADYIYGKRRLDNHANIRINDRNSKFELSAIT